MLWALLFTDYMSVLKVTSSSLPGMSRLVVLNILRRHVEWHGKKWLYNAVSRDIT